MGLNILSAWFLPVKKVEFCKSVQWFKSYSLYRNVSKFWTMPWLPQSKMADRNQVTFDINAVYSTVSAKFGPIYKIQLSKQVRIRRGYFLRPWILNLIWFRSAIFETQHFLRQNHSFWKIKCLELWSFFMLIFFQLGSSTSKVGFEM